MFCNHCGSSLPVVCHQCASTNPPESRFCHRCGDALSSRDTLPQSSTVQGSQPTAKDVATDLRVLGADLAAFAWPRILAAAIFVGRNVRALATRLARWFKAARARSNREPAALPPQSDAIQTGQTQADTTPSSEGSQPIGDTDQSSVPQRAGLACPRCRTVNQTGSLFCFNCGLPLDDVEADAPRTLPPLYTSRPAGFWIRLAAWTIDAAILLVGQITLIAAWPGIPEYFESAAYFHWIDALLITLTALYYTVGVSAWSTTVGKRTFGMYVLRPDGAKVAPLRALARYFTSVISFLILGVGYLVIAFHSQKRGMHDVICGTVVVRK